MPQDPTAGRALSQLAHPADLRDTDRVEIYRLLTVDPKEARRQRYQRHKDIQKDKPAAG